MRSTCVYCGRNIVKRSKEHVIQNALGGLLESDDICCDKCNNVISKLIDVPFTRIFNGIVDCIPEIVKTDKSNKPACSGIVMLDGELFPAMIKNRKVVSCSEFSKKYHKDIKNVEFQVVAYEFPIENKPFKDGLCKIAMNYALSQGVGFEYMKNGVQTTLDQEENISKVGFNFRMIPFVPMNPYDEYLELEKEFELFHHLILFNQDNQLWCYVNLFNTFQHYVLLSCELKSNEHICRSYLQLIEKKERECPPIHIRRQKHILFYSQLYGVAPDLDIERFKKSIAEKVRLEPYEREINEVYGIENFYDLMVHEINNENLANSKESIEKKKPFAKPYYKYVGESDEHDEPRYALDENRFRIVTLVNDNTLVSYPQFIEILSHTPAVDIKTYITKKFYRLNAYLLNPLAEDSVN